VDAKQHRGNLQHEGSMRVIRSSRWGSTHGSWRPTRNACLSNAA